MGKKKKNRNNRVPLGESSPQAFNNPFAALLKNKNAPNQAPKREDAPPATNEIAQVDPLDLSQCKKIVLQRERKKRRGHTALIVSGLHAGALEPVAKALRKALGCGAGVEGNVVIVQGDLMDRVETWLKTKGAKKVVRGN